MAGSSAFAFAREAHRSGLMSRRQIARGRVGQRRVPAPGLDRPVHRPLRDQVGQALQGLEVRDIQRMGPGILAGVLPRVYPQMLREAWDHQDAGRPVYIVTAASQEMAEISWPARCCSTAPWARARRWPTASYTGRAIEPFTYREGKAVAMRELAAREGYRPAAPPTPTRTRSPTCRCCARSATRSRSTPTPRSSASPARRAGRSCASSACGRRLFVAGGAVAALALGTGARAALLRRRQPPPAARLRRAVVRR